MNINLCTIASSGLVCICFSRIDQSQHKHHHARLKWPQKRLVFCWKFLQCGNGTFCTCKCCISSSEKAVLSDLCPLVKVIATKNALAILCTILKAQSTIGAFSVRKTSVSSLLDCKSRSTCTGLHVCVWKPGPWGYWTTSQPGDA